jgi:3-hydroxymyristoyl/3-hydroxydecanoyl-(acyl carrier protein) dehydratase
MADAPRTFCLPADHPVFRDHFPDNPIVPGVMLLEWVMDEVARSLARPPAALRVREAKFFTPLAPAQCAELSCDMGERRCSFQVRYQAAPIARGVLEWNSHE